jgi:hypothetical protein
VRDSFANHTVAVMVGGMEKQVNERYVRIHDPRKKREKGGAPEFI